MTDIERWITVNGNHIPIMKGENVAQALGNHFKKIRNAKLDKEYYKQRKAGKSWKEANEAIRQKIKGVNTDPDNKVKKAEAAYEKTWNDFDKMYKEERDRYKKEYTDYDSKRLKKQYEEEDAIKAKYSNLDNKVQFAKYSADLRKLEHDRRREKDYARERVDAAERARDDAALSAYQIQLYKGPGRYKLKEDKRPIETQVEKKVDKLDDAIRRAQGYYGGRRDEAAVRALTQKRDKLVESMSEKRKITGVKKPYLNENPEYTAFARYKPKNKMGKLTDSDYRDKKSFRNDLKANEFDRITIKDRRDMYVMNNTNYTSVNQLKKIVKGMKETENKYGFEAGPRKRYEEVLNKASKISLQKPKTFKDTTGRARKLVVKNAYKQYMKDHPNSKMKFEDFERKY